MARRFWGPLAPLAYLMAERFGTRLIGTALSQVSPQAAAAAEYAGRVADFFAGAFAGEPDECA